MIRIATLNLENLGDRPEAGVGPEERIRILRPQLKRLAADVLCLQEVNAAEKRAGKRVLAALDALLEGTVYAGFHRVTSHLEATGELADRHNLVILSRWPVTRSEQLRQSLVEGPSYRMATADPAVRAAETVAWDRPILHAEIALPEARPLHVVNVHLRAPLAAPVPGQKSGPFSWKSVPGWAEGFYLAMMKRSGQAFETRLLIDRLFDADADALIAVCGDMNAEAREVPMRILCADVEDTGNGLLASRMLIPVERSIPDSQRFTVSHRGHRLMLDHILVSRALYAAYRHAEVHNEALGDELVAYATVEHTVETYHAPVVAEFDPISLGAGSP